MKLKIEHTSGKDTLPRSPLAKHIKEAIESLPHHQRLYPDLYANSLAESILKKGHNFTERK